MARNTATAKKPWGGWFFCLFLITCGLACHAILMLTNFAQGYSLGHVGDGWSQNIFAYGALAIDLVGVGICAGLAGYLHRKGELGQSRRMMAVVTFSAAFSLLMFYGYSAANRIEPTKQAAARHSAELTAATKSEIIAAQQRAEGFAFLEDEVRRAGELRLKRGMNDKDRAAAKDAYQAALDRLNQARFGGSIEVKADPIAETPDPMATALAARLGWQTETVQELLAVWLSAMLLVIGSMMIRHGFQSWPIAVSMAMAEAFPAPVAEIAPALVAANDPAPISVSFEPDQPELDLEDAPDPDAEREADVRSLAESLRPVANKFVTALDQVAEWQSKGTRRAPAAKVVASDCHEHYRKWAEAMGYYPILTPQMFGRCMRELVVVGRSDMKRSTNGANVYYNGRALDYGWNIQDEREVA